MKIFVLTQRDAFYIPLILDQLLASGLDVAGIGVVPGELEPGHVGRYLRMMGPRDFALQSLNLVRHRVMDALTRLLPATRSWSVEGAARRAGVPCRVVRQVNDAAFIEWLKGSGIELLVSIACPQRLRRGVLAAAPRGAINLHGALLPRYQGLLPSFWVLAKGEPETGVTVHWMDEAIDHGNIVLQERFAIGPADTVHSLVTRSKVGVGRRVLVEAIRLIERGAAPSVPMDTANASYFSYPDAAAVREFRARGRRFI